jgi:hypothetical protein
MRVTTKILGLQANSYVCAANVSQLLRDLTFDNRTVCGKSEAVLKSVLVSLFKRFYQNFRLYSLIKLVQSTMSMFRCRSSIWFRPPLLNHSRSMLHGRINLAISK